MTEGTAFDACHREHNRVLTLVLVMRVELRQIESGKTSIEMKVQLQEIAGLTITQPRKLLGIAEEKFNLEAQFIELDNLLGVLLDIGTEQQTGANAVGKATVNQVGNPNLPFQRDVPDSGAVEVNLRLHGFHVTTQAEG